MGMGRKRKHRRDLPERVYQRHGAFYFVERAGIWHRLGHDFSQAMAEYARLNLPAPARPISVTVAQVMDRYQRDIVPRKSPRTQQDNQRELALLRQVFGHMHPGDVVPQDVYGYLDKRPPVRGNREKALLSHVFQYAIRWGLAAENPCRKVSRNPETPRRRYVTDAEYEAIYTRMPHAIQCAMALAAITGLRQGDILRLQWSQWTADGLLVETAKTGKRLLFARTPDLEAAIEACRNLTSRITSLWLIHQRNGTPYSSSGFRSIWQRRMRVAHRDGLVIERFTFHDLRAKAASDGADDRLLGHADPRTLHRHYKRAPIKVLPVSRKILDNLTGIGQRAKKSDTSD